jgi:glutathione S-transferase
MFHTQACALADMNLAMILLFALHYGAQLTAYPHLAMYAAHLKGEDSIAQTWPPHWKESSVGSDWLTDL